MFLEIPQNSKENTCARVSFFNKKTLFLRTPFLFITSGRLLLGEVFSVRINNEVSGNGAKQFPLYKETNQNENQWNYSHISLEASHAILVVGHTLDLIAANWFALFVAWIIALRCSGDRIRSPSKYFKSIK